MPRPLLRHTSRFPLRALPTVRTRPWTSSAEAGMPGGDFAHHKSGVARLNNGSFGAVPLPVRQAQEDFRREWLAQPDELYFSGQLQERMRQAAAAGASTLSPSTLLPSDQTCLLENATVATCAVAYHWSKIVQPGDVILYLDVAYKACVHILREYCERQGAKLVPIHIPFPATTPDDILTSLTAQLDALDRRGMRPRFAFLDHVSSQPAILLPLEEMIRVIRAYDGGEGGGSSERMQVCVDAAHSVGSVADLDIAKYDCDYYYSNLHKWAFAPPTATIFWSPHCRQMNHPITSWAWGKGLCDDALFTGTRDYSAMAAVPAAVDYMHSWRSSDGQTSAEYCHARVLEAAQLLREAWGTQLLDSNTDETLVATQAMVRLPVDLRVTDRPGQVSRGVRDQLRDDHGIEASVGNFGDKGNYLRLSWAVYTDMKEIERLAEAVLKIAACQ
jgi:selenocysteine lyase/cysteine desulfurase